ncbi:hypothetical protein [Ulvibacter antarcticus]|uniref:VCBS repeat protein n=1 Tax=Ulvibacter antarcticus TaxID=442714 RepID=A0A3L9Y8U2_9FLAO|nr:hypothetical protein [Ulvibacter antarcticus]RMA56784.1 hypothetical protein BXY75_3303 [Ulvibacter antarcticus]
MKYISLLFVLNIILFGSCNEVNPKGEKEVREFLHEWNSKHTPIKAEDLKQDYMDVVTYFGAEMTKEQIQLDKIGLFQKYPDLKQSLDDSSITIEKEDGNYLITFTKQITYNEVTEAYPSFLSVIYKNGEFRILREGVTAANTSKNTDLAPTKAILEAIYKANPRLYGDFNGDGSAEYAIVKSPILVTASTTPKGNVGEVKCKDGCTSIIKFSDPAIPSISISDAYKSNLVNLGDLNNDTSDEIGFWNLKDGTESLYVYNAVNGKLLASPITINIKVHKNLKLIDVIKKVGPKKIRITESVLEEDGNWKLKSRVILLD